MGRIDGAIVRKADLQSRLREWFETLPRSVTIACDSQHDRDLLGDALGGEWPANLTGWFDQRPLVDTGIFDRAVVDYHSLDRPWHHSLYDAHAHRAGWMAWMDHKRREKLGE